MHDTTMIMAMVSPCSSMMVYSFNQTPRRPASVAPDTVPARMPTSVMPICTLDRNRLGSSISLSAARAPLLPRFDRSFNRALREDTTASSDMDNTPLISVSRSTKRSSKYSIGSQ